jgi:hypothetical protein
VCEVQKKAMMPGAAGLNYSSAFFFLEHCRTENLFRLLRQELPNTCIWLSVKDRPPIWEIDLCLRSGWMGRAVEELVHPYWRIC